MAKAVVEETVAVKPVVVAPVVEETVAVEGEVMPSSYGIDDASINERVEWRASQNTIPDHIAALEGITVSEVNKILGL
jgi:hypothetical protein